MTILKLRSDFKDCFFTADKMRQVQSFMRQKYKACKDTSSLMQIKGLLFYISMTFFMIQQLEAIFLPQKFGMNIHVSL